MATLGDILQFEEEEKPAQKSVAQQRLGDILSFPEEQMPQQEDTKGKTLGDILDLSRPEGPNPAVSLAQQSMNRGDLSREIDPGRSAEEDLMDDEVVAIAVGKYGNLKNSFQQKGAMEFLARVKKRDPKAMDEMRRSILAEKANTKLMERVDKVGEIGAGLAPWIAGGAALTLGAPLAAVAPAVALVVTAKAALDRYNKGKSTEPSTGIYRALAGAGTWIDPRAESEMPEHAIIARDALDALTYFGIGGGKGSILNQVRKEQWPVIKAGLQESVMPTLNRPNKWLTDTITDPLWEGLVKAANKRIIPSSEKMYAHGHESTYRVKKSVAEIMQPAIERLDPRKKDIFRQSNVYRSQLNQIGHELGNIIARETDPKVAFEIEQGLRGTPVKNLTTQRAKDVVNSFDEKVMEVGLPIEHENAFREAIGKSLGKRLGAPEEVFMGDEFTKLLDPIVKRVESIKIGKFLNKVGPILPEKIGPISRKRTPVEELQKGLRDLIGDPSISKEYQTAAKDLHNLAATIPEEVAKASDTLAHRMVTENLLRETGTVLTDRPEIVLKALKDQVASGKLKPAALQATLEKINTIEKNQYLPSTWKPFIKDGHSLYVQRDTELELKALSEIPDIANKAFNKYFMSPWKMAKVMLRPAAWGRNGLTNLAQNHMGGLSFWKGETYLNAYRGMRGDGVHKVQGASVGQHWKDYNKITGGMGTFAMDDIVSLGIGMKDGSNMLERALGAFDKITAPAKSIYSAQEQLFKFAKYLDNIEKGMGQKDAAWDAMKWTFNYGEITRATAKVRTYFAPFFTWQSKVFPQVLEQVVKHPIKFTGLVMLYNGLQQAAIEQAGVTAGEWNILKGKMPEYLQSGLMFPMPWRDQNNRLQFLDLTYIVPGFGDAYQMSGHPMAQIFQNPLVSIAAGFQANKKYSGAPIWYDWEPATTKLSKMAAYTWEQLMPAPMPGGTDWNNMYQAFIETPLSEFEPTVRDLTRMQALSSQVGFKVNPVDIPTAIRSHEAIKKMKSSEISADLKRQLRNARSSEERQQLINKYSEYFLENQTED